jgi:hypothetical protein
MIMTRNASFYVKTGSVGLLILIILGYAFFQAHNLIFGPHITLTSPLNGATYTDRVVEVRGIATNAAYFSIDDKPVLLDKNGAFDESLLLPLGYTIIKLDAVDQFGKSIEKTVQIIYQPPKDSVQVTN